MRECLNMINECKPRRTSSQRFDNTASVQAKGTGWVAFDITDTPYGPTIKRARKNGLNKLVRDLYELGFEVELGIEAQKAYID